MIFINSNFSEKSAWISLIFTVVIAGYYANGIQQLEGAFATHADQIVGLWATTIVVSVIFIIIAMVLMLVLNKINGDDEEMTLIDERDEVIEAKATRWAYFNMCTCITVMLVHIFCQAVITHYPFFPNVAPLDFLIHGLMFSSLLVEFSLRATQVYRYRQAV